MFTRHATPRRRRVAAMALVAAGALLLGACSGGSATDGPDTAQGATDTGADTGGATGDDGGGEAVTLTFMRPGGQETITSVYQPMLDDFVAEHPEVTIEPTYMGFDEAYQRMPLMASTGELPDVFLAPGHLFYALAASDVLMPLSDSIPDELQQDVTEAYWPAATWNGEVVGVPTIVSPYGLWYNVELFEEAGLDPDAPPATWDELVTASQAIKDNTDAYPIAFNGFARNDLTDLFASFYASLTGEWNWDDEAKQLKIDDPALAETLGFMTDLVQEHEVTQPNVQADSNDDARALFRDGQAAMLFSGPPTLSGLEDVEFEYRTAGMPAGSEGVESTAMALDSWAVAADTEHPDIAQELVWHLMSADNVIAQSDGYGTVPALDSVLEQEAKYSEGIWPPFIAGSRNGVPAKPSAESMAMADTGIPTMVQRSLAGEMSPQESIDAFASEMGWD